MKSLQGSDFKFAMRIIALIIILILGIIKPKHINNPTKEDLIGIEGIDNIGSNSLIAKKSFFD